MTNKPIEVLNKFAEKYCVKIAQEKSASILKFGKSGILIEVTVPEEVLEWFVTAMDVNGQSVVEWWCDYEGYDNTPSEKLINMMSNDIDRVVHGLLTREVRLLAKPKSFFSSLLLQPNNYDLEWFNDGNWEVALQ